MPPFSYSTPIPPLVGGNGRVRTSPLVDAVASRAGGNTSGANRAPAGPASSKDNFNRDAGSGSVSNSNEVDPTTEEVQAAVAAAEAGDQTAIDWLKTAGLVGLIGAGAGAAVIARSLAGRKKLGADNIAVDAAASNVDSTSSAKPKALPGPDTPRYLPRQAAKKLPNPTTIYQNADAQPLALPNPNAGVAVPPAPAPAPLRLEDKNAAGRAKAAEAEREGWAKRLGGKFKTTVKGNPAKTKAIIGRVLR